jgi:hypothetical protein
MWGDPRHNESIHPGDGQLATALFDVQVGALLLLGCAVTVLLCRSVHDLGDVMAVLLTLPCVLLAVNGVLARVVGSSLTAAVIGGVVLVAVCVGFARIASSRLLPNPQHPVDSSAGRLLLLALVMTAAGAVLALEMLEPAGWIVEALPGLISIMVVQGALIVAMLSLIAVMAVRWTVVVLTAAAVIAVVGGWLVLAPVTVGGGSWILVALGAVLVTASAASGSENLSPRPPTRLLAVAAAPAAFCVLFFPASMIGFGFGMTALTFAGGELGADGASVFFCGALAGLAGFAGYASALMWPNRAVTDEPPASPPEDLLTHAQ